MGDSLALRLIRNVFSRDSFAITQTRTGSQDSHALAQGQNGGGYGMNYQYSSYMKDQIKINNDLTNRFADYEDMEEYPEIGMAYRIYADEATQNDPIRNQSIWVESQDQTVEDILNYTLHKNLNIEDHLWDMAFELASKGNLYEEIVVIDGEGVVKMLNISCVEMRRVQDRQGNLYGFIQDENMAFAELTTQNFINDIQNISGQRKNESVHVYEPWEVVHFRFGAGRNQTYGHSVAEPARWVFKRLSLMEDSMVLFKLTRSPQRYVYYVDVGDVPPNEANRVLNNVKQEFKKQKFTDEKGKLAFRYSPLCISLDTSIPNLDGSNKTLDEMISSHKAGEEQWVYAIDRESKRVVPGKVSWAGITKKNAEVVKVTLNNGEVLTTTPDHKFMLECGTYRQAKDLKELDKLMSLSSLKTSTNEFSVKSVEFVNEKIDTGCITVDEWHNFATEAGVFIKNSIDEDFFMAKRNGERKNEIEVLSGLDGQETNDAEYFKDKLFAAIGVPKSYLGADETIGRANLGIMDVRFAKTILRLQRAIKRGINHICEVDLASRNIDPDLVDYEVKMVVPSGALEVAQFEVLRVKIEIAQLYQGLDFPEYFVWSNVLGFTDDEIVEIQKQRDQERAKGGGGIPAEESYKRQVSKDKELSSKKLNDHGKLLEDIRNSQSNLNKRLKEVRGLAKEMQYVMRNTTQGKGK